MPRPNIVLVFMDDLTHWAVNAEPGWIRTPNLDRLAARGTRFTHAFNQGSWAGAVCVPARAMLLTGRTLFHAGAAIDPAPGELGAPLLGEILGAAGYRTYFTGKWHNPGAALRRSYAEVGPTGGGMLWPATLPDGSADVGRPAPGNTWDPADPAGAGHWLRVGDRVVHSSEYWVDNGIAFLDGAAGGPDPFFLHVALHAPHDPRQAPRGFHSEYPAGDVPLPPNLLPEHPFDQGDHRVRDELLAPFPRTAEAVRLHRSEYAAIVTHADEQIGRLLAALDAEGVSDRTLVVFSGDHGLALGEHGLMGKQSLYDHSTRVPLLLAGPGVPAGARVDVPVYQASILATLCELAGVPRPAGVEFPSLVRHLTGPTGDSADGEIFGAYRDLQRMVRIDGWSLIAYRPARRVQLFHTRADPWQLHDRAADGSCRERVYGMLERLRDLQAELDDDCGEWTRDVDDGWLVGGPAVSGSPAAG